MKKYAFIANRSSAINSVTQCNQFKSGQKIYIAVFWLDIGCDFWVFPTTFFIHINNNGQSKLILIIFFLLIHTAPVWRIVVNVILKSVLNASFKCD